MPEQKPNLPNALQALFLILLLFFFEYFVSAAMYDLREVLGLSESQRSAMIMVVANGILFTILMHIKQLDFAELFHSSQASPRATFILLLGPIALTIPALTMTMGIVTGILTELSPLSEAEVEMFESMASTNLAATLTTCVLAPVLEEMLFRGIFLRSFLRQYPAWPAIFISATLFGLAHMNLYQMAVGLALGTFSGWLYYRTRSLIPSITLHALYNSTLVILEHLPESENSPELLVLVLTLASGGIWMLRKMLGVR